MHFSTSSTCGICSLALGAELLTCEGNACRWCGRFNLGRHNRGGTVGPGETPCGQQPKTARSNSDCPNQATRMGKFLHSGHSGAKSSVESTMDSKIVRAGGLLCIIGANSAVQLYHSQISLRILLRSSCNHWSDTVQLEIAINPNISRTSFQ